ncbi:MAG: DNA polymerase III subunit beta [Lachnospiraceae bacterium]|nr:DNA polymerase III subunit beta [Lachnospiraceae bacterium]MBQ6544867.1 DNA polymerase III subunit beta [Lachnospiraceae bacterium]
MKIVCSRSDLQKAIAISMRAVPVHTTMPILECIMIVAESDGIHFISNDTELGIETVVPGSIVEKGRVAIQARMLSDMIRKLPDNEVIISVDESKMVKVVCERANFQLAGLGGEDFTYLPVVEKEDFISISQYTLKDVIQKTIFSIAVNENNRVLSGELFRVRGDEFQVVSLDGHRISIRNTALKEVYSEKKVIVPGKTLSEISKILGDDAEENVNIYFAANHIVFEMKDTTIVSRLIDGEFFRIENMLSSDYETKIRVGRRELLAAIDRSTLFVRENDKKPIIFNVTDGYMQLSIDSQIGSMQEEIDVDKEGKDIMIGFNPRFMMDALRAIEEETVTLYLVNPKAPCFIRNDTEDYIYIILPVNFIR